MQRSHKDQEEWVQKQLLSTPAKQLKESLAYNQLDFSNLRGRGNVSGKD